MGMTKITVKFFLFLILGSLFLSVADARAKKPITPGSSAANPIPVVVATVNQEAIPQQVDALGSLKALEAITVSSEVSGRVAQIFFKDGQQVAKGMPIVQLHNAQDLASYQSAVTALNLAKVKYQRAQLLLNEGGISQQDVDQLRADVENSAATVDSSSAALGEKELTAPFNGTLGAFQVEVGDYVNQGQPLVTLVNRDQLEVVYSLPEQYLSALKLAQIVMVRSNAYPNKSFQGTVTYVAPSVDEATRSIGIQATIDNKEGLLSPGLFVHVTQTIGIDNNALVVPEEAVTASVKGYTVYKVVNGQARLTLVQLGVHFNGQVQVTQGLSLKDVVVTAGQQKLQDGSYVAISQE